MAVAVRYVWLNKRMNEKCLEPVVGLILRLGGKRSPDLLDRDLVGRSAEPLTDDALSTIIHRHGPMVYGLCRRHLRDANDIEDIFQATFVALAANSRSIRHSEALAGWLYRVTLWIIKKARRDKTRHLLHERRAARMKAATTPPFASPDCRLEVDEELHQLPPRYRDPLVLCGIQGLSNEEAANALGLPLKTLQTRLARGREMLRKRLQGSGVALSMAGLSALLTPANMNAAVPAWLGKAAWQLASAAAAQAVLPAVPATILGQSVATWLFWAKVRAVVVVGLLLAICGGAVSVIVSGVLGFSASTPAASHSLAVPVPKAKEKREANETKLNLPAWALQAKPGEEVKGVKLLIKALGADHKELKGEEATLATPLHLSIIYTEDLRLPREPSVNPTNTWTMILHASGEPLGMYSHMPLTAPGQDESSPQPARKGVNFHLGQPFQNSPAVIPTGRYRIRFVLHVPVDPAVRWTGTVMSNELAVRVPAEVKTK